MPDPDHKWLDQYRGQTVEQLLSLADEYSIPSIILAFEQALSQKSVRDGAQSLTAEEHVIIGIEEFEREVNNGGFSQFLTNSSREYAPLIVDALLRIGCPETAELTRQALAALNLKTISVEAIEAVMENDDDARDSELAKSDAAFFSSDEPIAVPLFKFIEENRAGIRL